MTFAGAGPTGPADSFVQARCLEIALDAGAITPCAAGHPHHRRTFDNRAEARAFAHAAIAQSKGDMVGYSLEEVIGRLGRLLDSVPGECPACTPARAAVG